VELRGVVGSLVPEPTDAETAGGGEDHRRRRRYLTANRCAYDQTEEPEARKQDARRLWTSSYTLSIGVHTHTHVCNHDSGVCVGGHYSRWSASTAEACVSE